MDMVAMNDVSDKKKQDNNYNPPLPPEPTEYLPGTQEKLQVMIDRRALGYHIHHPLDAKFNIGDVHLNEKRMKQLIDLKEQLIREGYIRAKLTT